MLKETVSHYWKENVWAFVITATESGGIIVSTVYLAKIMNSLIQSDTHAFISSFFVSLGAWAIALLFGLIRLIYIENIKQKQLVYLKKQILAKLSHLSYEEFHMRKSSEYISWLTNDINLIEEQGFSNLYRGMSSATLLLFSAVALFQFHWLLLIISLVLSLLMVLVPKLFKRKLDETNTQLSKTFEKYTIKVDEWINGFDTLYYHNKTKMISQKLFNVIQEVKSEKLAVKREKTFLYTSIRLTSIIAQYTIILVTGVMILGKKISAGSIFSIGDLTGNFFGNTSFFIDEITNFLSAAAISKKVDANLIKQEVEEQEYLPYTFTKEISIEDVSYQYDKKEIQIPNMTFKKGKKYAITGKSGSGKSTFLNIITKNYLDFKGKITFDHVSLRNFSVAEIKNNISYVAQGDYIFDMTLEENITLEDSYSSEQIASILEQMALDEPQLIKRKSLITNGINLSGGQVQRVSLSRGLIHAQDILIIDEGTSHLDPKTAKSVEQNILENPDLTVIFVTHHLNKELIPYFEKIYSF